MLAYLSAPSLRFVPRWAQLSASQNSSCLQKRLRDIRVASTPTVSSAAANTHTHGQCVCLFTLEVPIASQAINQGWGWCHQILLTSSVTFKIHLQNWNNTGARQDKGFISFLLGSNPSHMPHITVSDRDVFPSRGGDARFWLNYQVVNSLSPACSLSCLRGCSPVKHATPL